MFENKTLVELVTYEVTENEPRRYELHSCRRRCVDATSWRHKMKVELRQRHDADGLCVVAYVRADGNHGFEDGSYAVVALEQMSGRSITEFVGDEIADELQLW